jgi:hypothetical protein
MQMLVRSAQLERATRTGRFVAWVALFALLQIAVLEYLGWITLVGRPPAVAARLQHNDMGAVFFPADARNWAPFKLQRIADEQPEIIAIGNSRCGQLRSAMFRPYKFYNACLTAWTIPQLRELFDRITDVARPRVVLFSMDYFQFTKSYEVVEGKRAATFDFGFGEHIGGIGGLIGQSVYFGEAGLAALWDCLTDAHPKYPVEDLYMVGVQATRSRAGFRWDGSMLYQADDYATAKDQMRDILYGLIKGIRGAPHADEEQLIQMAGLAADARAKGIQLVGIQFPIYAPTVDFLDHDENYQPYAGAWRDFESAAMKKRFAEMGIIHLDLSRAAMTSNPENFIDAAHPSEAGMVAALIEASRNAEFTAVFPKLDIAGLKDDLGHASDYENHYHLYRSTFVK